MNWWWKNHYWITFWKKSRFSNFNFTNEELWNKK